MAMIECPNCRMQISDKARKCVHCGTVFMLEEKKLCVECGAELEESVSVCPMCGCPVEADANPKESGAFQRLETVGAEIGRQSKNAMFVAATIVFLLIAAVAITIGINQYQKKKSAEETARHIQEYAEDLDLAVSAILSEADDAGSYCSLIDQVWYNAIYEKANNATDKFTQPDGHFVEDFNEALNNLFADSDFNIQINNMIESQKMIKSMITKLENPPEEYRDTYESLSELYDAYLTLTNMAINPTGSLNSFSAVFNDADAEFIRCCQIMKIDIGHYQENRAAEKAARLSREYFQNLWYATDSMLSGAANAENCCNLIVQVWNNAIWEKEDSATDRYTRPNGRFVEDFNEALDHLFADPDFYTQIDNVIENQKTVNSIVEQLKNPPTEYKAAYESLSECYDAYWTFTNMAINPTGSLNTFSADFDEADTKFMHCYHVMEFYLQD